jgi:aminopeptidase-like protein/aminoglycoside N3'-acetyltransferase
MSDRTATMGTPVDHRTTFADVADGLRTLGVGPGDVLYVQVCRAAFEGRDDGLDAGARARSLYDAIRGVVGESGTILAPAFTFSFCRQEPFDVESTPTVSGPWNDFTELAELVRSLPGSVRSADPIFSTAGAGPEAQQLLSGLPRNCLGPDCVHDRLRRAGGKICILGVGLYEAIYRHHVESVERVPWRYDKLFTGQVREGGAARQEGWIYNVRIRAGNGDPAGEALEALARDKSICRSAPVGAGELLVTDAAAFHELASAALRRDPWFTAKGPPGDPVAIEAARTGGAVPAVSLADGASMLDMIDALWQLPRDIISDGYDAALAALATQLPMTIHEFPTGSECWTWVIPEKWTCREAYLETLDGRRLFSYADHPLHVVSYSLPFEGEVTRDELLAHLHVHPTLDDAVPFIFKYYDRDWGLCCSRTQRDALTERRYRVVIRSEFSYGTLKVGEVVLPGETDECVVLCAHLCHPHMVNDDLTGVVVGMDVMRELARRPRRYTYRFVVVPETIGSVAYLSRHEHLIPLMRGGLFLEMLGKPHPHALQRSFDPEAQIDQCFAMALRAGDDQGWLGDFRRVIGNDERQYNAPGVRVPMLSLSRVHPPGHPDYPYREYHSSFDRPDAISAAALEESRDLVLAMLEAHEGNRVPVNRFKGEVFMARYGLFVNWYADPAGHRALFDTLFLVDGTRTVVDIARTADLPLAAVQRTLDELERHGLVDYRDPRTST